MDGFWKTEDLRQLTLASRNSTPTHGFEASLDPPNPEKTTKCTRRRSRAITDSFPSEKRSRDGFSPPLMYFLVHY